MDKLLRLKDNIVYFLSPPSKRQRTLPETPAKEGEHHYLTPHSDIPGKKGQASALGRSLQNDPPTTGVVNPRKRGRAIFEEESPRAPVAPGDSVSNAEFKEESVDSSSDVTDGELDEELDEEIDEDVKESIEKETAEEKVAAYLARQAELATRLEDIEKLRAGAKLHPDALFLFERISMRSFEPILPASWKIDFPTLPKDLFTTDPKKQLIGFKRSSSLAGVKALQSMICLSERVCANLQNGRSTERVMTTEVKAYIRWSEKDAGYNNCKFLPVLVVVTRKPGKPNSHIGTAITNQMTFLAEKHRELLANPLTGEKPDEVPTYRRQPPLLYGIILAKTIAILVTMDSAVIGSPVQHLTDFDFSKQGHGVWSGLGLAMMMICARNYQLSIRDEFEDKEEVEDPDL